MFIPSEVEQMFLIKTRIRKQNVIYHAAMTDILEYTILLNITGLRVFNECRLKHIDSIDYN